MKDNRVIIPIAAFTILICVMVGCVKTGADRKPGSSDTLYTWKAAMDVYSEQPRRALEIVDSGEMHGSIKHHMAELARARIYSHPSDIMNCDTARQICINLLQDDSASTNLDYKFDVLDQLRTIAYVQGDDCDLLHWSTLLVDVCREQKDEVQALRTEAEIGYTLNHLGQNQKGLQMLDKVIGALDGKRKFDELDACIIAMKRKLRVLLENKQHAEAVPLALRIIEKCNDYEQHPTDYSDGSFHEPAPEDVKGYCDFYRSQGYALAARAYSLSGDLKNARRYVEMFEDTEYGHTLEGRMNISSTWLDLGDYDKMLMTYGEMEKRMGSDTLNNDYAEMLENRAIAAGALKQFAVSEGYWKRHARLTEILYDSMMVSKAHSYAARYNHQQQQALICQKEYEANRNIYISIFGLLAALAALCSAIYFYRQKRILAKKNQVIMEQIHEAMIYQDKYLELANKRVDNDVAEVGAAANQPAMNSSIHETNPKAMSDEELFQFLSDVILKEQLYTNPGFGRQSLVDRFSISPHRVGAAFARGSQFNSLPDFIRDCRLQHACKMLLEQPGMSISEIAIASGFNHLAAFSRVFKDKYSMSPSDYRNNTAAMK